MGSDSILEACVAGSVFVCLWACVLWRKAIKTTFESNTISDLKNAQEWTQEWQERIPPSDFSHDGNTTQHIYLKNDLFLNPADILNKTVSKVSLCKYLSFPWLCGTDQSVSRDSTEACQHGCSGGRLWRGTLDSKCKKQVMMGVLWERMPGLRADSDESHGLAEGVSGGNLEDGGEIRKCCVEMWWLPALWCASLK